MAETPPDIADAASKPRSASQGDVSESQHSLPDLIEADRYLSSKQKAQQGGFPGRLMKIKPGAAHE